MLIGLENDKQAAKRTGVVGHKSLSAKRVVVESLSDIETSIFKALLTCYFLIIFKSDKSQFKKFNFHFLPTFQG